MRKTVLALCQLAYAGDQDALLHEVLNSHHKLFRPVQNYSQPVGVKFGLTLKHLIDLDISEQTLTTSAVLNYNWQLENVFWDPEDFDGVKSVVLPAESIWTPDVLLQNSVSQDFDSRYMSPVHVNYIGDATWSTPAVLKSSCQIDEIVPNSPADRQSCELKFGSWSYEKSQLNLQHFFLSNDLEGDGQTGEASVGDFVHSNEWKLVSQDGILNEVSYTCCPETFQDITFSLELKRQRLPEKPARNSHPRRNNIKPRPINGWGDLHNQWS